MDVPSGVHRETAVRPIADRGEAERPRVPELVVRGSWDRFRCSAAEPVSAVVQALLDAVRERLGADDAAIGFDAPDDAAATGDPADRDLLPRPPRGGPPGGGGPHAWLAVSPAGRELGRDETLHRLTHPIHLADGRLGALIVQRRDPTFGRDDHHIAGAAAARLAVLVERLEHESTLAELQTEALRSRESRKLETAGTLVRGVAHDVNNLLLVILGGVQLLTEHASDDPSLSETASRVREAISLATALSRQLVDFSRARTSIAHPIRPDAVVTGIDKLLATLIGDRCQLRVALAASEARILAEPAALAQVVLNLTLNARDAMPNGGVVEIRTALEDDGGRSAVRLTVRDEGVGIEPDIRDRIFEPLFTTKGPERGSGLGLSNVARIVDELGGTIRVTSEPGHGATFDILVPTTDAAERA